ncbi:Tripartite-type tricarboxylate transporter, receptor component TctC [Lentibacillus persicus]|uniref:Tripartite-type tricarboxylate transporter, receptor component TctC n=1 Tax=Lentibacillus persicus TaxID=640948 RepID=A0A1I1VX05_9BACI|nr:tripartite tricarboxylate transporter substrate binding protein [Lentibacillus persicus]SFD87289.1 Tripartite-type tricarboxylate transporter, receptor component TctC [Lentibacillus persicus]
MKKLLLINLAAFLAIFLAACGNESSGAESYPNKPIELIVPYAPGGGTDLGARELEPYIEDELGVSIEIINKEGAGGWAGWTDLINANPDGYTLGYLNTPNLTTGYLNPELERGEDLDSFSYISNHVSDPLVLAVNKDDDRFETVEDFIEYAKENEVTTSSQKVGSSEHVVSLKMNEELGTNIGIVQYEGVPEIRSDLMSGDIDSSIIALNAVYNADKEAIKPLAIFSEERSEFLPDVPTMEESGYEGLNAKIYRGIGAPAGVDSEKISILEEAFKNAIQNEEHQESMKKNAGIKPEYQDSEEFRQTLEGEEEKYKEVSDLLGW